MTNNRASTDKPLRPESTAEALEMIHQALGRIRYGAINLTLHDGKVVQLDVTERKRFSA